MPTGDQRRLLRRRPTGRKCRRSKMVVSVRYVVSLRQFASVCVKVASCCVRMRQLQTRMCAFNDYQSKAIERQEEPEHDSVNTRGRSAHRRRRGRCPGPASRGTSFQLLTETDTSSMLSRHWMCWKTTIWSAQNPASPICGCSAKSLPSRTMPWNCKKTAFSTATGPR